jgi:hypothetical protein
MLAHLFSNHVQNRLSGDDGEVPMTKSPPAGLALLFVLGCASSSPHLSSRSSRELVVGYDDNRPREVIAFPTTTYEAVTRFDLPAGQHHPLRLRLQAQAPGALEITLYDSTPLETPGEVILTLTRSLDAADVSDGKDGRWVVEELAELRPLSGVVWVGVRKSSGQPTLWSSGLTSGQSFIRNNDPQNPMGLLPTKRSPMLRLELTP